MNLTVALGQMDVAIGQPEENFRVVQALAHKAAKSGADLLLVPELWSTGYALERAELIASPIDDGLVADFGHLAAREKIALFGSTLVQLPEGVGNTAVLFDRDGHRLAVYSKIHLFGLMDEPRYLVAGNAPTLVETPWGKAGLAICYDLRFPELFRAYALAGADLILLVAEWPMPRLAHWQTLLRARAIENQVFVIACNRAGSSGETTFFGHSTVVDPWGEVLFEADDRPGLHTVSLDLTRLAEARQRLPILRDRRPECYSVG
jgi:predicted amidohydrolase